MAFTYDPAKITAVNATAGPAALTAAKTVQCAGGSGTYICLVTGLNLNTIQNGTVVVLNATLSSSAAISVSVGVANPIGASSAGTPLALSGTAAAISVSTSGGGPPPGEPPTGPPPSSDLGISDLSCDPSALTSGASATCTVTVNQPAPSGGASVALFVSSTALQAPSTVTVPGGSSSATFSVTASVIASDTSALLTAVLNGMSQRLVVTLTAPVTPPTITPAITGIPAGVLDAAGYTPNVAQGGVFVVKGSNLAPDGVVQAAVYPLTTTLNGVSITFSPKGGGAGVTPYLISTYRSGGISQLAALLPSAAAPGSYDVTVTANGMTSAAVPVTVVSRKFRLFTADSSGSGAAALQTVDPNGNYHYNRFTTQTVAGNAISPAHPGDYVVAYGTGLGGVLIPDQSPPGVLDLRGQANIQVLVAGEAIAPVYAGRSPAYPGIDQINFQLPADVLTGCTVMLQVSVDGKPSNAATISIAPPGSNTCSPAPVSSDVLSRLDQGGSLTLGNFWLTQLTPTPSQPLTGGIGNVNESAFGSFVKYSGSQLASAAAFLNPVGSCQVSYIVGNSAQLVFGPVGTYLDAGPLTLAGSGISNPQFALNAGTYFLPLGASGGTSSDLHLPLGFPSFNAAPTIGAGIYQLAGSGGADIGAFSASVTIGLPLMISGGLPVSINRSSDLTLSWAPPPSNSGDVVSVTGISGTIIGGTTAVPVYEAGKLTCTAMARDGTLKIPSALLAQLPATPAAQSGIGYLGIASGPQPISSSAGLFTAPLAAGGNIDGGFFLGARGLFGTASYQ